MKVSFVLLSHEPAEQLKPLVTSLLASGSNVFVHHDRSSSSNLEEESKFWNLEQYDGNIYFAKRIKVVWGEWSIVEATLNCLDLVSKHDDSDYLMLISGSCMPIKPIRLIEEYLGDHPFDFIESVNVKKKRWITAGIQEERWEMYHFLNWRFQRKRFDWSLKIQKKLNIKRTLPFNHIPHMGSQWWCLRRTTIDQILALMSAGPELRKFYSRTWIPDELFFQTMVGNLIPREEIFERQLTRYSFNSWGIPRVYYDDSYSELLAESKFIVRKVSSRAVQLKEKLSDIALMSIEKYESLIRGKESIEQSETLKQHIIHRHKHKRDKWHALIGSQENIYDYVKSIPNQIVLVCSEQVEVRSQIIEALVKNSKSLVVDDLFYLNPKPIVNSNELEALDEAEVRYLWQLYLGDTAYQNPDKVLIIPIGMSEIEFIPYFKWNEKASIFHSLLVNEGVEKTNLKALAWENILLNQLGKEWNCQLISYQIPKQALPVNFEADINPVVAIEKVNKQYGEVLDLGFKAKNHYELVKRINSKIIVFLTPYKGVVDDVNEFIESRFNQKVYSDVLESFTQDILKNDWGHYLNELARLERNLTNSSYLFIHLTLSELEALESLRWKKDLLIVNLNDDVYMKELEGVTLNSIKTISEDLLLGEQYVQLKSRYLDHFQCQYSGLSYKEQAELEFIIKKLLELDHKEA